MMYLAATVFPAPLSPLAEDTGPVTHSPHQSEQQAARPAKPRPPDDDALVLAVNHHVSVHVVSQSVDVRRVLILGLEEGQNQQNQQQDKTEVRNS